MTGVTQVEASKNDMQNHLRQPAWSAELILSAIARKTGLWRPISRQKAAGYFSDDMISSQISQSSISRNWRKTRLIHPRSSSSSRGGSVVGVERQNWANEKLCCSTSGLSEAGSTGISSETDTALSFGKTAQYGIPLATVWLRTGNSDACVNQRRKM